MEHPRTHSVTAAPTTPGSTRNSSTSSAHKHAAGNSGSVQEVAVGGASASGSATGSGADTSSNSSGAPGPAAITAAHTHTHTHTPTPTASADSPAGISLSTLHRNSSADEDEDQDEDQDLDEESLIGQNSDIGSGVATPVAHAPAAAAGAAPGPTPLPIPGPDNLFKQFDSKTGQFMRTQAEVEAANREHSKEPVPPTQHLPGAANTAVTGSGPANAPAQGTTGPVAPLPLPLPQFRLVSNFRNRSHSVPTILHSSLKRISNHGNIYNGNASGAPTIITHPMNPYGIVKKKQQRSHNHGHGHGHGQTSNALNTSSIRNAILLSQQAISASASASSSTTQVHRHTANMIAKNGTQQTNKNIGINIHNSSDAQNLVTFEDRVNYVKAIRPPIPLPPINLQCLKEIDLQEIVKNPQLRHDIIFDPLLQFRPNLDGERGIKKKQLSDVYWKDVENELIVYAKKPEVFDYNRTRLVPLFDTLREVLLTIVPQKEAHQINNILDTELNVQELIKGSLVMTNLSNWLATLFKHHCAPMRDTYVDKMSNKFKEADAEASLPKFMDGLKLVFQILEAMKLDIANHQIRLLRPALLSNAVEFEKQYFNSLITSRNALLKSSLVWFESKMNEYVSAGQVVVADKDNITIPEVYKACIKSVISLLSCRKMVREFPTSLSFDHARLILLRADIRQLVCLLVCRLLFQQLVTNDATLDKPAKMYINGTYTNKKLKDEIISIITDEHGNCRWTKNTLSISVHLCKVIEDLKREYAAKQKRALDDSEDVTMADSDEDSSSASASAPQQQVPPTLDNEKIRFAKSWLSKQTQPLSEVYGVLENRVFKSLEDGIYSKSNCTVEGRVKQDFVYLYNGTAAGATGTAADDANNGTGNAAATTTNASITFKTQDETTTTNSNNATGSTNDSSKNNKGNTAGNGNGSGLFAFTDSEEFENVYRHLYTVINLHWSVFGTHYVDILGDRMASEQPLQ